jgi:hypothetical protein
MIDAIYIQSWHGELDNGDLERFLQHLHDTKHNPVPIWVFLDQNTLTNDKHIQVLDILSKQYEIQFEFVDDTEYKNAQTTVFYHMLRSKSHMYPRILLLESDCRLLSNFDTYINQDIQSLDNWWIYGSTYYGIGGGEMEQDTNHIRRNHMNGVAVYNRTPEYLNYAKLVFETELGRDSDLAFDWLFAMKFFQSVHKDTQVMYDSPYIINLSPVWDREVHASTRKPLATIVHQKSD